mmetsp:Transcript_21316/g.31612  ORF Transcript_21316/g.31612 Transcript_21316/m.31612 type:complete len:803 (+) Transcript_21316:171-2579(+)|eukprot:CAMPEP_0194214080 /NCGR_PEP_ID=MMETSP0156-20130528/15135_1 /TAXON_ID=33649 /ORGANISM="Thalassionema nitzschioides, Strain L26-B" /LENGTH=802 /DNA_ID=CAMNT_0038942261 /DNA_START=89 /DNA_END=2497 /DNA_ORIENTATION=+
MTNDKNDILQGSPRSAELRGTIGVPIPSRSSPQSQSSGISVGTTKPIHRRTHSEELNINSGNYHHFPPPPHQFAPSPRSKGSVTSQPRRLPQGSVRRSSHRRANSWNPPPPMGVVHGLSSAGNPLIPVLQDGNVSGDPFAYGSTPGGSTRRKRSYSGSSAPTRGYQNSYPDLPPPPPSVPAPPPSGSLQSNRSDFSPRNEIMSLAKGFHVRRNSTTPPVSPGQGGNNSFSQMSPRISPQSSARGFYGSTTPRNESIRGFPSWQFDSESPIPNELDNLLGNDISSNNGGEAVFEAQRRGSRRPNQSSRKMHMRQHSAQLFMQEVKGIRQKPSCRDILFVLMFLFHLVGMAFLGTTYGLEALTLSAETPAQEAVTLKYMNFIYLACLCGAFAVVVSTATLFLMIAITERIVQMALVITIAMSFAWGTIGIGLSPHNFVPVTGIIALALSVAYAFVVWDRIPFASSNLHAGLSALRANAGTILIAFFFQIAALAWTVYYTFVLIGVYDALEVGDLILSQNMQIFVYTMLGISYYWTFHIFMNIVQVTVTSTIGMWWFRPGAAKITWWNEDVSHSLFTSMFYSIGSICFGSLVVGPVRFIRQLSAFFRPSSEETSLLMCLHECVHCVQTCIANCVDNLSDHFNPWAMSYVGLYGYGLLEAGHKASELFEKRGWTTIVSDDLLGNVLLMFSVVVGGVTGCFGMLIQDIESWGFTNLDTPAFVAFLIGLGIGLALTSVLFATIAASVNAVIVCFAGSPLEFERNHPDLSARMRNTWREVWPGCMEVIDHRVGHMPHGGPHPMQHPLHV